MEAQDLGNLSKFTLPANSEGNDFNEVRRLESKEMEQ